MMAGTERTLFGAATTAALCALAAGLMLPAFEMDQLGSDPQAYSVLQGGTTLLRGDSPWLGVLVLAFSAAFPVAKLLGILALLARAPADATRAVHWLEWLGKWSMLDVFVVATLIGAAQLGILAEVSARPGVYWFLAAVIGSIALSVGLGYRLGMPQRPTLAPLPRGRQRLLMALSVVTLLLFAASLMVPLVVVEKWWFWSNDMTLGRAPFKLWREGEAGLAVILAVFVIALPLARLVCLAAARLLGSRTAPVVAAYHLDKWSMLDVYALALLVFVVKMGSFADIDLRPGFHLLVSAVVLGVIDGVLLRRSLRFAPSRPDRR